MKAAARNLRVPHAAASYEDSLRAYNDDVYELAPVELEYEVLRTLRIVFRNPSAFVWRELAHITAREWGEERIALCRARLDELMRPEPDLSGEARPEPVSVAWSPWQA